MSRWLLAFACLGIALAVHQFTVEDMTAMDRVTGPAVSPDGQFFVFSSRIWNKQENKVTTLLYLQSVMNGTAVRLTNGHAVHDTEFCWSPDSKMVFFLTDRSGSNQLWAVDVATMQMIQLTFYPVDIDSLKCGPAHLAFSAAIFPGKTMAETANMMAQKAATRNSGMLFDHLMIRHWDTWFDGTYRHLFTVPLARQARFPTWNVSGEPLDLTNLLDTRTPVLGDTPSKPWGGSEEIAFSADGNWIAFSIQQGTTQAWNLDRHMFIASPNGKNIRDITPGFEARANVPAFSPDSKSLAYLATVQPGYESDRNRIRIYDIAAQTTTVLTEDWDVSADGIAWSSVDPANIYALCIEKARVKIYAVPVVAKTDSDGIRYGYKPLTAADIVEVTHEHTVNSFALVPNQPSRPLLMSMSAYTFPTEIFGVDKLDGTGTVTQLTDRNGPMLAQTTVVAPSEEWFHGAYDDMVHSWFFKPHNYVEGRKYPLVLYVHGGPENPWEDTWSYRWNPQAMAAQGYAVFAVNFHGSSSFGDKFTRAILLNWGGCPFEDLTKGLDFILDKYAWLDKDRVVAMGASYGGFMINWLNGHTTRFKALVCHDGVFNTMAHYYETEELYFPETEFGGPAFKDRTYYERYNPSLFVSQMQTPQLTIHGSRDYRIPDTQGISAFTAHQRKGIPSKLLIFPEENHWVLNPNNSIRWHNEVIAWFKQWAAP